MSFLTNVENNKSSYIYENVGKIVTVKFIDKISDISDTLLIRKQLTQPIYFPSDLFLRKSNYSPVYIFLQNMEKSNLTKWKKL